MFTWQYDDPIIGHTQGHKDSRLQLFLECIHAFVCQMRAFEQINDAKREIKSGSPLQALFKLLHID